MWNCDDYKNWLRARLIEIKNGLDFSQYEIEVFNEQDYAKNRSIKPKTITFVAKFLPSSLIIKAKTQPVQMLVITEENGIAVANTIATKFCETYNFAVTNDGSTYVKHIYSTPTVLSNFNLIGIGLRTVLYVNTTLLVLDNVMDVNRLKVTLDGKETATNLDPMSATIGYTMEGDPEPFDGGYAKTEKSYATFVLTLNVACVKDDFTEECMKIMNKTSTKKGDENFTFDFYVGDLHFENFVMKLKGCALSTAKNNVPSLQFSFSV